MFHSRRISVIKGTQKQSPIELTQSLKNVFAQQAQSQALPTAAIATMTQVKSRRPPSQRQNDILNQNTKAHTKESPTKRDSQYKPSEPYDSSKDIKDLSASRARTMDKPIRHVVSESLYPGARIKMIISLPTNDSPRNEPDLLKTMVSSESIDDLESTTKGNLQFPHECSVHFFSDY
jgi:hypothetical protein